MRNGDLVECVACDGKHTGKVVAEFPHLGESGEFGVAWDAKNPNWGKPGNKHTQFPREFVAAHHNDISFTKAEAIRPRR